MRTYREFARVCRDGRLAIPAGATPTPDRSVRLDSKGREYVVDDEHADDVERFIDQRDTGDPRPLRAAVLAGRVMLTMGWPQEDSKPTGDARWLDVAKVFEGWTLEARTTLEVHDVSRRGSWRTAVAGSHWNVYAVELDEAVLTAVVPVPSDDAASIRISLVQPGFGKAWKVAGS